MERIRIGKEERDNFIDDKDGFGLVVWVGRD